MICENKSDCKAFFIKKDSNNMDKCFLCDSFSDSCQTLNLTQDDKTKLTHECYYDENKTFDEYTEDPRDDIVIDEDVEIENVIESSEYDDDYDYDTNDNDNDDNDTVHDTNDNDNDTDNDNDNDNPIKW